MVVSVLSVLCIPGEFRTYSPKSPSEYPQLGLLVEEFDIYRERYAGAVVTVYRAGTTELVPLYTNIDLTGDQVENPQVLLTREDDLGNRFGKFKQSIYSPFAYELDINTVEQTGIREPAIFSLAGEDASDALSKAEGATNLRRLSSRFADRINILDFGEITSSPETNTANLTQAISKAALQGGGRVYLPSGTIVFNKIVLPANVILSGEGIRVTNLVSQVGTKVITVTGNGAGLENLTLDGVNLTAGSIGIYGKALNFISLTNAEVRRFATGIHWQGGQNHVYRNLFVRNCVKNCRFLGDSDSNNDGLGDEFSGLDWFQGEVAQSTGVGIEMAVNDLPVRHNAFHEIDFLDNVGLDGAVTLYGASWTTFRQCYWDGNDIHIAVSDNPDDELSNGKVVGLQIQGGQLLNGTVTFDGICQDIIMDQMQITGTEFQLNIPENQIVLRDSVEEDTLFTGDATKLTRFRTLENGTLKGSTVNATGVIVWKTSLNQNEVVLVNVCVTAEQINGPDFAVIFITHAARCAPATLNYDEQSANFTVGSQIEGATSGATGIITADSDSGTTGVLSLARVSGTFIDNELINEIDGLGSARVNGAITLGDAALIGTATTQHAKGSDGGNVPSGWAVGFQVSEQEFQITVTGAASKDISWNIKIDETRL